MAEYDEGDIDYITGLLDGVLLASVRASEEDKSFDPEKWRELYGSDVTYSTFPSYPSEEAMQNQENVLRILDWVDEREVSTLVDGAEVPMDRTGTLVFADGTVVSNRSGEKSMYSLSRSMFELVSQLRDHRLKILREVYDDGSDSLSGDQRG